MKRQDFDSLIDSLAESVKDYNLDESFDHWNAIHEICASCDHSFVYGKAWRLVDYTRFVDRELFDKAASALAENDHNTDNISLDDYMLSYAFHILQIATLEKWEESQAKTT